jgi:uncharacterized protein YkwD
MSPSNPRPQIPTSKAAARHLALAALGLTVLLTGAACGGSGSGPSSPTDPGPIIGTSPSIAQQSFQFVNRERGTMGVSELTLDPVLCDIARAYSEEMRDRGFFDHTDPNGMTVTDRLRAGGEPFTAAGENLAKVSSTSNPASFAHQQLMASPGHRANILEPMYTKVGIGVASSGGTYWFTQVFVR